MRWIPWLFAALTAPVAALEPFLAPPVPTGSLSVRLVPTEVVRPGEPVLVTFGLPFPRGSITAGGLDSVRVLHDGVELPAFVESLTPWRHRVDAAQDGASVRVARLQFQHAFAGSAPENVTVSWGGVRRERRIATLVDPRSAWHPVASGSFVAADGVTEPDVYAVLPADWLSRGLLKSSRSTPFDAANREPRDDPAAMDAIANWDVFREAERASKNNFYAVINQDDPRVTAGNRCRYKTDREPWLYDRAATMFVLYFRSGFPVALREAVQAAQFYAANLDASGHFRLAPGDAKYAYNESLAYAFWLTGDERLRPLIERVAGAHEGTAHAWRPQGFWTERHVAYKLLAQVVAWEVAGGSARAAAVDRTLADLRTHQDGANGQIPAERIDGGLYHYGHQHDGDWADERLGASSWMSALLADAAVRAYAGAGDAATARFVQRLGRFLRASVITTREHSYDTFDGALALPRYAVLIDGSDGQRNREDIEHALDVAGQMAWAWYFSNVLGAPEPALRETALALYASYDAGVNHWIRPSGPASGLSAYRVSPWRKWSWEHRSSDGLAFALGAAYRIGTGSSGVFSNPAQDGHGWVLHAVDDGRTLVASWFTYAAGAPRWFIGAGPIDGARATVALSIGEGGDFPPRFDARNARQVPWGSAVVEFADADHARVSWTPAAGPDMAGAMDLLRLAVPAQDGGAAATAVAPCHSGGWYDPAQPGHGLMVEVLGAPGARSMVVIWYAYLGGAQRWLVGSGGASDAMVELAVVAPHGADFPPRFDPAQVVREPWGTLRMTITDATRASLSWDSPLPGYGQGSLAVQRLYGLAGRACA